MTPTGRQLDVLRYLNAGATLQTDARGIGTLQLDIGAVAQQAATASATDTAHVGERIRQRVHQARVAALAHCDNPTP